MGFKNLGQSTDFETSKEVYDPASNPEDGLKNTGHRTKETIKPIEDDDMAQVNENSTSAMADMPGMGNKSRKFGVGKLKGTKDLGKNHKLVNANDSNEFGGTGNMKGGMGKDTNKLKKLGDNKLKRNMKNEEWSITNIAASIPSDDGVNFVSILESMAHDLDTITYNDYATLCQAHGADFIISEDEFVDLLSVNPNFNFLEHDMGGERAWAVQMPTEVIDPDYNPAMAEPDPSCGDECDFDNDPEMDYDPGVEFCGECECCPCCCNVCDGDEDGMMVQDLHSMDGDERSPDDFQNYDNRRMVPAESKHRDQVLFEDALAQVMKGRCKDCGSMVDELGCPKCYTSMEEALNKGRAITEDHDTPRVVTVTSVDEWNKECQGTKWCDDASIIAEYLSSGPIYVVYHDDGMKYACHPATGTCVDIYDQNEDYESDAVLHQIMTGEDISDREDIQDRAMTTAKEKIIHQRLTGQPFNTHYSTKQPKESRSRRGHTLTEDTLVDRLFDGDTSMLPSIKNNLQSNPSYAFRMMGDDTDVDYNELNEQLGGALSKAFDSLILKIGPYDFIRSLFNFYDTADTGLYCLQQIADISSGVREYVGNIDFDELRSKSDNKSGAIDRVFYFVQKVNHEKSGGGWSKFGESRSRRGRTLTEDHDTWAGEMKVGIKADNDDSTFKPMGKEWPRRQKNVGPQDSGGTSKHRPAKDGITKSLKDGKLGQKTKNSGGQWEPLGNHVSGGGQMMKENVTRIFNSIKPKLATMAQNLKQGQYSMNFRVISPSTVVESNILAEALIDAEELAQVSDDVQIEIQVVSSSGKVANSKTFPIENVRSRGPVMAEGKAIFRLPATAHAFADHIVSEGHVCRVVSHNWGAMIETKAPKSVFAKTLSESIVEDAAAPMDYGGEPGPANLGGSRFGDQSRFSYDDFGSDLIVNQKTPVPGQDDTYHFMATKADSSKVTGTITVGEDGRCVSHEIYDGDDLTPDELQELCNAAIMD